MSSLSSGLDQPTVAGRVRFAVEIEYMRRVRWSLLRIGCPLIGRLFVRPLSLLAEMGTADIFVRIRIAGFVDTGRHPLTAFVDPSGILPWDQSPGGGTVDFERAMCLRNARDTRLELQVGTYVTTFPITLLTPDEWCPGVSITQDGNGLRGDLDSNLEWAQARFDLPPGGAKQTQLSLAPWDGRASRDEGSVAVTGPQGLPMQAAAAVLVQPEHPLVMQIKNEALQLLPALTGDPHASLIKLVAEGRRSRRIVIQALYAAMAERYGKAVHDLPYFGLEERSQRIRFADLAMGRGDSARHGATCVDFVLFFCGLLLACGLDPLLILVATGDGLCHALVGSWLAAPSDSDVLETDGRRLRRLTDQGDALIIDVTELTRGTRFDEVCRGGANLLSPPDHSPSAGSPMCYALDIRAVLNRDIRPLPLVQCAPIRWRWGVFATAIVLAVGVALWQGMPPPPLCRSASVEAAVYRDLDQCGLQRARNRLADFLARCPADSRMAKLAGELNGILQTDLAVDLTDGGGKGIPLGSEVALIALPGDPDGFRLVVKSLEPTFVYVFGIDQGNTVETLFPVSGIPSVPVNPLSARASHTLPTPDPDYVYSFHGPGGQVTEAVVVVSRLPLANLERWGKAATGEAARGLRQALVECQAAGPGPWSVARIKFQLIGP